MVAKIVGKGITVKPSSRRPITNTPEPNLSNREVLYPSLYSEWYLRNTEGSAGPLNSAKFKELLGWEDEDDWLDRQRRENPDKEDKELEPFPKEWFLMDQRGKKVLLHNNSTNRPFGLDHCLTLAQDILNRFWADSGNREYLEDPTMTCNGEAMIIGRTGLTLSIQHRGLAVIFAEQIRQGFGIGKGQEEYWEGLWGDNEITIEGVINYGISESNRTLRTFDNVKPRTFSDVLFSDPSLTANMSKDAKLLYTKTVEFAIKCLWERTGEKDDSHSPRRTHSEAMDFLFNHPSLKSCALAIIQANGKRDKEGNKIAKFVSLGDATGICYLMSCSEESGEQYWKAFIRKEGVGEDYCKATRLTQAIEFWKRFATHIDFAELRSAIGMLSSAERGITAGGNRSEKFALLCHAWEAYLEGEEITGEVCKVKKKFSKALERNVLDEFPDFGGIDKGPRKSKSPPKRAKGFRPLSDTDIDAIMEDAQNDNLLDESEDTNNVLDEGMRDTSIIEEEQLDTEFDDLLMEGDEEDRESVEQAHRNHIREVEEHNTKVLQEEKERENPTSPPMTPTNAFAGWDKPSERGLKPRKIKRKL